MAKLIRVTTVPMTLRLLCSGLMRELAQEGYDVIAISSPNTEEQPNGEVSELAAYGEQEGVRTVALAMERQISPLKDLKSLWQMWRVLRREKPDMVHSMTPKAGLITMMAAWLARVPVRIHTFTGLVFPTATGLKRRILMATDWLTCACATHVIPEGEGVKADLLNNGITRKPIKVLGHGNIKGIDLGYYNREAVVDNAQLQSSRNDPSEGFTFVFVGRIVRDKGINELVGAFKRLHEEFPEVRLVLVGPFEDSLDPVSPETKAEIDSNPGIEEVGIQRDVRPFYAAADALVFPSYREGFPNVVIEAGAMELPSIVTDINGSREIIIEGQNGTIIPPRDEETLYQTMRHWVTHRDEVKRMAAEARPLVASRYEQGYIRQCLKEFYKECRMHN